MDFKKLISKLDGIEAPEKTPQAPTLPKSAQLNEEAQLRVLAGTSTILAESELMEKKMAADEKTKKEKAVKESDDRPDAKKTSGEAKLPSGAKVKTTKVKGWQSQKADKEAEKNESIDVSKFKNKFDSMVEAAKSKPDFLDMDKDGDKEEPMKKAVADKKKGAVKEAADERPDAKKTKGEVKLPSGAKVKSTKVQGWQSQKADKAAEKNESKMMTKGKKRPVKESVEQKLSFKEMVKLVQESGGQQRIDAKDTELFDWAKRVAKSKLGEGMKAEVYAGLVYERMGGRFEMYDVLSETMTTEVDVQKKTLDPDNIDYKSLEVDGIDYSDAPDFVDAYFSNGYHLDGTELEDWELEELSNDYDLVHQYVINRIY